MARPLSSPRQGFRSNNRQRCRMGARRAHPHPHPTHRKGLTPKGIISSPTLMRRQKQHIHLSATVHFMVEEGIAEVYEYTTNKGRRILFIGHPLELIDKAFN